MKTSIKESYNESLASTVINNMKKRGMEGYYCKDAEEACDKALKLMPSGSSVSWGGSVTLGEIDIIRRIKEESYDVIDRDTTINSEEYRRIQSRIVCSDYFLMSTNALTTDGELVNIDGRGNRVSYLCFGPQNVIVFAGMNKISADVDSALKRIKTLAAPMNCKRLKRNTPCSITGVCSDCYSADCICSDIVITRRSHVPGRIKIILIGGEYGY